MEINSHIIKLSGRAELPNALEMSNNYKVTLQGAINNVAHADNDDGTKNVIYTFKPVVVEIVNEMGEKITAKDSRSKSQLFRARMWKMWTNANTELSFEDYYDRLMNNLILHAEEITGMYGE